MRRTEGVVILGIAACLSGGCSRAPAPAIGQRFSWEVRGDGSNVAKGSGGSGSVSVENKKLEIKNGRMFVNGNDRGALSSGDRVVLDKDGRLFVNGQERAAP